MSHLVEALDQLDLFIGQMQSELESSTPPVSRKSCAATSERDSLCPICLGQVTKSGGYALCSQCGYKKAQPFSLGPRVKSSAHSAQQPSREMLCTRCRATTKMIVAPRGLLCLSCKKLVNRQPSQRGGQREEPIVCNVQRPVTGSYECTPVRQFSPRPAVVQSAGANASLYAALRGNPVQYRGARSVNMRQQPPQRFPAERQHRIGAVPRHAAKQKAPNTMVLQPRASHPSQVSSSPRLSPGSVRFHVASVSPSSAETRETTVQKGPRTHVTYIRAIQPPAESNKGPQTMQLQTKSAPVNTARTVLVGAVGDSVPPKGQLFTRIYLQNGHCKVVRLLADTTAQDVVDIIVCHFCGPMAPMSSADVGRLLHVVERDGSKRNFDLPLKPESLLVDFVRRWHLPRPIEEYDLNPSGVVVRTESHVNVPSMRSEKDLLCKYCGAADIHIDKLRGTTLCPYCGEGKSKAARISSDAVPVINIRRYIAGSTLHEETGRRFVVLIKPGAPSSFAMQFRERVLFGPEKVENEDKKQRKKKLKKREKQRKKSKKLKEKRKKAERRREKKRQQRRQRQETCSKRYEKAKAKKEAKSKRSKFIGSPRSRRKKGQQNNVADEKTPWFLRE